MKQYSIRKILFVILSTAVIVSCQKEKEPLVSSANNGNAIPSTSNYVYSDSLVVSDTNQVFNFLKPSTYPINCYGTYCTVRTRYIFHKDGSFVLQFDHDGVNENSRALQYKGRFTHTNNSISFTWEGWSVAGPWGATGTLRGDTLTVRYNMIMILSDFEDAVYLRKQ